MKKLLITFDINYTKEITDITCPYMKSYANKIGADFKIITERKFQDQPIICEKFQVYDISKEYDWTILIDCDAIIHPNCPDVTEVYNKDVVIFNAYDLYPLRFKPNNYSRKFVKGCYVLTMNPKIICFTSQPIPRDEILRFIVT